MTHNALIALAGGTAIALTAPLAAQGSAPGAAGQPAAAQPSTAPAAGASTVAPANSDDPSAQSADPKSDPKVKAKATGGTVVRAGPNAGTVIGGKKSKGNADDAQKGAAQQGSVKCDANPCQ